MWKRSYLVLKILCPRTKHEHVAHSIQYIKNVSELIWDNGTREPLPPKDVKKLINWK